MKARFNTMSVVGAIGGGMVPSLLDKFVVPSDTTATTKALIYGAVGAGLSAFTQGDLLQGMASGILGVAGQTLGNSILGSSVSGVGLLPGQAAIMGQKGIGAPYLPRLTSGNKAWSQSKMQTNEVKKANVI